MAKIQNPQNEKAETLATDNRVNQLIAEQFLDVNNAIEDKLTNHKEELTSNNKNIHVDDADRERWDNAVQSVTRAPESSDLLSVTGETNATISLSTEVASKADAADISSEAIASSLNGTTDGTIGKAIADAKKELSEAITDKTIGIKAEGDNITATLDETLNYTISVDGYTTSKVDTFLNDKADKDALQQLENNLSNHISNEGDVLHVTQAEKDIWNAGGNALQEIIEGNHIEVDGNTVGVNTTSLVADTIFTTKVNDLIGEELSIVEESINNINNELETYNYSVAQSIETGTAESTANTRGFGTLITNDITLGKVITYCHSTGGNENNNIWLKVFEESTPHIFKGISDAPLNHKHGATLEYTFKNSDIKLEAKKEYFFVFCSEEQKNSTTFQNSSDSIDCCIQTVTNTTGHGGVCGSNGISLDGVIALHKIYKKPGKFAFAADLEEETEEIKNLIKNKVEALPSVYTGDNLFYTNCYGFEYTNPSENIIFDKIEIKFAKNLDTLTEWRAPNAPEISPLEVEDNICKIVVAKVKTPPAGVNTQPPASAEKEIATSSYNTNISNEVNLSQFKFSENILLENGWNYRFYFYDKNDNLFPASIIVNFILNGDTTLKQSSVANRYLSERYDYWGTHGIPMDGGAKYLNGLGIKLINSIQEHVNKDVLITVDDKNNWNTHINNDIRHFKENEHEQLFSDEKIIFNSEKNVLTVSNGTYYGIQYKPFETFKFDKISIVRNSTAAQIGSKYLFIFKQEGESKIFVQKCITRPGSSIENNVCYWEFEPTLLEKNISYFLIFRENENEEYSKTPVALQALQQSTTSESLYFINDSDQKQDAFYVPNIKIYGEGRLFATIDDLDGRTSFNLYDKTDNVTTVSNSIITFFNGDTVEFNPENIISAHYAFRATNTTSSQLTEFNKRTVYAHIDGTIETATGVNSTSQSSATQHCRYEQDLVDQDDEATQSLSTLINGTGMFVRSKLTLFNDDLTCLTNGKSMFASNYELTEFKSPLPSLVYGKGMFTGCRKLTKWRVKLPSLVIANNMFSSIASNEADYMQLAEVDTCLPNLTIARQMFAGCRNLTKFHVPSTSFSNLYDAQEMFRFTKITSINGNFESLENGERMFADGPTLDVKSVQNIAETIRDWSGGYPGMTGTNKPVISLGTLDTSDSDIIAALDKIKDKGWEVEPDVPEAATLNSDTIGFFARVSYNLIDKTHIDENGNQCSLVLVPTLQWITNKDVWSPMVSSIEEAETYFSLSKIETSEETI